jgi:hypothetical protein
MSRGVIASWRFGQPAPVFSPIIGSSPSRGMSAESREPHV